LNKKISIFLVGRTYIASNVTLLLLFWPHWCMRICSDRLRMCGYARNRKLSNVSVKSASWHWCNGRGEFIWRLTLVADNLGYVRSIRMPPSLVNDNVLEGAEV